MELPIAHVNASQKAKRSPTASMASTGLHCMLISAGVVVHLKVNLSDAIVKKIIFIIELIACEEVFQCLRKINLTVFKIDFMACHIVIPETHVLQESFFFKDLSL